MSKGQFKKLMQARKVTAIITTNEVTLKIVDPETGKERLVTRTGLTTKEANEFSKAGTVVERKVIKMYH